MTPDAAARIATAAHAGQVDKSGADYIAHPETVARLARHVPALIGVDVDVDDAAVVGWLHDVVEDTPVSFADLIDAGLTDVQAVAVGLLTHRPGTSRADYLRGICESPLAVVVKVADNWHNSHPARLAVLDVPAQSRLARKYAADRSILAAACPRPLPAIAPAWLL